MKRKISILLILIMLIGVLAGCKKKKSETPSIENKFQEEASKKGVVYTGINSTYQFSKVIAGSEIQVLGLVPSGTDVHDFELTPKDMKLVEKAKAFLYDGIGLEPFIEELKTNTTNVEYFAVAPTENLITNEGNTKDPHVWMSPKRMKEQLKNTKEAFDKISPEKTAVFQKNYEAYLPKLEELDSEFAKLKGKKYVVTHNAFKYQTEDYGIDYMGVTTDGGDPSPARIKEIVDYCKKNNIKVIYRGRFEDEKLAKTIADEAGLTIKTLDYFEDHVDNPTDYYEVMQMNLKALKGE